jgi:hypothetical protein
MIFRGLPRKFSKSRLESGLGNTFSFPFFYARAAVYQRFDDFGLGAVWW